MAKTTALDEFSTWFMNSTILNWNNETLTGLNDNIDGLDLETVKLPDFGNSTSTAFPYWYPPTIYAIATVGIVLNLVFLFTVARVPSLRTVTTYYLVNMCLTDLTYLIISMINAMTSNIPGEIYNNTLPTYVEALLDFIATMLEYVSVLTIVTLSIERFIAIYKPNKFRGMISKSSTIKAIAAIWFVATLLAVSILPLELNSTELKGNKERVLLGLLVIPSAVCILIVLVLYSIQIIMLYHHQKRSKYLQSSSQVDQLQVVLMLILTAVVYVACFTPINVTGFMLLSGVLPSQNFTLVCIVFVNINASVNMIIYNAVSTKYRRALTGIGIHF